MEEQAGFKTSMFGFRKTDVLACIDRLSAEMLEVQEAATQREHELEESLESACSEKEALAIVAEEKSAEITTLRDAIVQQQALVHTAEAKAVSVQQQLAEAETSAHDYKTRLFASEGEATILRRDNAQLTQAISQKEKALEGCEQEAKMISEHAAQQLLAVQTQSAQRLQVVQAEVAAQLDTERAEAEERLAAMQAQTAAQVAAAKEEATAKALKETQFMQQQNAAMQDKMRASARDMTEDVRLLKEALATLDEKIESSLHDLQRSTDVLSKALEATEQNMQSLGLKLETFPEVHKVPSGRAAQYHNASASAQVASAHVHAAHRTSLSKGEPKTPTISSMLLAKIGKMISEV